MVVRFNFIWSRLHACQIYSCGPKLKSRGVQVDPESQHHVRGVELRSSIDGAWAASWHHRACLVDSEFIDGILCCALIEGFKHYLFSVIDVIILILSYSAIRSHICNMR